MQNHLRKKIMSIDVYKRQLEDKTNVQRIYMLAKYGVSVPGGNGLPPGQAMGDGSFSALMAEDVYKRQSIWNGF